MTDRVEMVGPMATDIVDQKQLAEQLLQHTEEQNIELVRPGGLLNQLTKSVLETALDAEMAEHLGYEKHDPAGHNGGNSRNGTRSKTVLTEIGPVEIEVPRDTESTFELQIVKLPRALRAHRQAPRPPARPSRSIIARGNQARPATPRESLGASLLPDRTSWRSTSSRHTTYVFPVRCLERARSLKEISPTNA
jgi:Transposase, Mutator family